jgi:hypothetical protein
MVQLLLSKHFQNSHHSSHSSFSQCVYAYFVTFTAFMLLIVSENDAVKNGQLYAKFAAQAAKT